MENVRISEQKKQNILHLGVYFLQFFCYNKNYLGCLELTIKADIRSLPGMV